MKENIFKVLDNIKFGKPQTYRNMTILPLIYKNGNKVEYISLNTALKNDYITIKELDEGATVSELKVINHSKHNVLIIDGEQFVGAKQNRIINASVFVGANSKFVIDVSCVEEGRWHHVTDKFKESDNLLISNIRAKKVADVNMSLRRSKSFMANQGEIWNDIHRELSEFRVASKTSAMEDFYKVNKNNSQSYLDAFKLEDEQNGVLVFINDKPMGIEYISDTSVFAQNFTKIVKSYVPTAIRETDNYKESDLDYIEQGKIFLANFKDCEIETFKSLGMGNDLRFNSEKVTASALVVENELIHFVGFPYIKTEERRRPHVDFDDDDFTIL